MKLPKRIVLLALLMIPAITMTGTHMTPATEPMGIASPAADVATEQALRRGFKGNLIKAIRQSANDGKITRVQALRLRMACLSPAFVKRAQDVAVIQMVFSGDAPEAIPRSADGRVNVEGIDWEGLTAFLVAFIPILLELLLALGL